VHDVVEGRSFEDCRIPLAVVLTDIEKNEEVVCQKGNLSRMVRASCSWPGIFTPVRIEGRLLVDGGVKNSVPVSIARKLAPDNFVIAVDVGFCVRNERIHNIFQMILQSFQIMGHELNRYQASTADYALSIDLKDLDQTAFHQTKEAIHKGSETTEKRIGEIRKALGIR
jgi:NTE family protein